jgi:hypothetical protein
MNNRKRIVVPLLIGIIGLTVVTRNPRFADIHAVDALQLLASGMCFGISLGAMIGWLRRRTE